MSAPDTKKIEEIENKIVSLISYRAGLTKELRTVIERTIALKREVRKLTESIRTERAAFEQEYAALKNLENESRELHSQASEIKAKIRELQRKLKESELRLPYEAGAKALRDLKEIEWKLETARLTREEQKRLVSHVKELETKLVIWRKASKTLEELNYQRDELRKFTIQLEELQRRGTEMGPGFVSAKDKTSKMVKARDQLFRELDEVASERTELESKIGSVSIELEELRNARAKLTYAERAQERQIKLQKQKMSLEQARQEAKEKLAAGRKLTLDELRLVMTDEDSELLK